MDRDGGAFSVTELSVTWWQRPWHVARSLALRTGSQRGFPVWFSLLLKHITGAAQRRDVSPLGHPPVMWLVLPDANALCFHDV